MLLRHGAGFRLQRLQQYAVLCCLEQFLRDQLPVACFNQSNEDVHIVRHPLSTILRAQQPMLVKAAGVSQRLFRTPQEVPLLNLFSLNTLALHQHHLENERRVDIPVRVHLLF